MIEVASHHQIFPGLVTIWYPITLRSSKTENILSLLVLWYSPPTHHCNGFLSYFSSVFFVVYLLQVPIWRVNIFSMKLFTVSVESAKFPLRGLSYRYHYKTLTVVEVTWQGPQGLHSQLCSYRCYCWESHFIFQENHYKVIPNKKIHFC